MSSLRVLSSAARRASSFSMVRRGLSTDKISLSLVLPHETIFSSEEVTQVNIPAESGDMGILSNHVPSIEVLRPGVLEVMETKGSQKFFVSSGFATVHPNNVLTINAVEAAPLESLDREAVRSNLQEALKVAGGNGSEAEKMEARVQADVYELLQNALAK